MYLLAYATKGTVQLGHIPVNQTHFVHGSHEVSQPISTPTSRNYHQIHFITCTFSNTPHFFHRNPWSSDIPPTTPEIVSLEFISRSTNEHTQISSFLTKIDWMGSQIVKYLRIKVIAFSRTYIC